jgi:hypothetical protein
MKQLTLCLITLFFGYKTVNAQYDNSYRYRYSSYSPYLQDENGEHFWLNLEYAPGSQENKKTIEKRLSNKLKSISKTNHNKKGEKSFKTTHFYNELGRLIKIETYSHKKEKSAFTTINYLNDSIISSVETLNYKGEKAQYAYTYLELNNKFLLTSAINTKKGEVKEKLIITRNESGKITSRKQFYGKNLKKSSETKNEYNDSGDLIKTSYFHNGKLKSVYNYDCNPEGKKEVDKKVNVSDVCKWTEERNDGSYIIYSRSTSKNANYLNVWMFNKDSMLISNKKFLNDSILVSSIANYDNYHVNNSYTKKQKFKSTYTTLYDDEHNLLEQKYGGYTFMHKYSHYVINEYKNNQLIKTRSMGNGDKVSEWTYQYNDKGFKESATYKWGLKLKRKYNYTFEYTFY